MKLPETEAEVEVDLAEIEVTANHCWATFALHRWRSVSDKQLKRLVDVIIASNDQVRAIDTLRVPYVCPEQLAELRKIAA